MTRFLTCFCITLLIALSACDSETGHNEATGEPSELEQVIAEGRFDDFQAMVEDGLNLTPECQKKMDICAPLHLAAKYGRVDMVELLLQYGADINQKGTFSGDVALGIAAFYGQPSMVSYLLERGADPNIPNAAGLSPFIIACGHLEQPELIHAFLSHGAQINAQYSHSMPFELVDHVSALMYAAQSGKVDVVRLLLNVGADSKLSDSMHKTAVDYAVAKGHKTVAEMITKTTGVQ